jgi:hypothetical protein
MAKRKAKTALEPRRARTAGVPTTSQEAMLWLEETLREFLDSKSVAHVFAESTIESNDDGFACTVGAVGLLPSGGEITVRVEKRDRGGAIAAIKRKGLAGYG